MLNIHRNAAKGSRRAELKYTLQWEVGPKFATLLLFVFAVEVLILCFSHKYSLSVIAEKIWVTGF